MNPTPICKEEAVVRIRAEPDDIPVRGNAMASGDDAWDRRVENDILRRLGEGGVWAWAAVTVTVSWGPFSASGHLGCCSYADEEDFRQPGGYFDDMVDEALLDLNKTIKKVYQRLKNRERSA